jgi:hypothetical protein
MQNSKLKLSRLFWKSFFEERSQNLPWSCMTKKDGYGDENMPSHSEKPFANFFSLLTHEIF